MWRSVFAAWRPDELLPGTPFLDWTFVDIRGRGVFVGDAWTVLNPTQGWWGEGDEKIYVDGETFPSTFGTGTEDYYGYAWGSSKLFSHAYHNQTRCDGPGNSGLPMFFPGREKEVLRAGRCSGRRTGREKCIR